MKDQLTIGSKWRINYGANNRHNKVIKIRAIVDNAYVVHVSIDGRYKMEELSFLELLHSKGHLKQIQ